MMLTAMLPVVREVALPYMADVIASIVSAESGLIYRGSCATMGYPLLIWMSCEAGSWNICGSSSTLILSLKIMSLDTASGFLYDS